MSRPGALLTDLYQLTMLHAYVRRGMEAHAVFELFVRQLPPGRGFLVAVGLEQALEYLETLRFTAEEIAWLSSTGRFDAGFLRWLEGVRFTGDVDAMAEGTVCFADEPIVRVTAPLPQAQLIESRLVNLVHFETVVASKAARCVLVAPGKQLVDFGFRRAHGAEAGLLAARAAYLAGFAGTATVAAGMEFGIPIFGTIAHSFVQAYGDEAEAFLAFARDQPGQVVLLLDTYDTEAAAARVVALAPRLAAEGITIRGVRLDSGDLAEHARRVRRILDAGGLRNVTIFASGNLDEYALARLVEAAAPIDGFGVGTHLTTSADAPLLDMVYKLQEYAGRPTRKRSEGKATWPGRKQVYRTHDADGCIAADVVTLADDRRAGTPLLQAVMRGGRRVPQPALEALRARTGAELARLPPALRRLDPPAPFAAQISPAIRALTAALDR